MASDKPSRGIPIASTPRSASSPPPQLLQAVAEFNEGAYFTCHETLEALWLEEQSPVRDLYKGILQTAAALWHMQRGNVRSAVSLLTKALPYLEPFAPEYLHIDVTRLISEAKLLGRLLEAPCMERQQENKRLVIYLRKHRKAGTLRSTYT